MPRLPLSCLLLPLLASAIVHASDWRQGWGLVPKSGTAAAGDDAPQAAPTTQLRLQAMGGQWQARIDNPLAGPVQIELRPAPGGAIEGLPVRSLVQGGGSLVIGHLPAPAEGRSLARDRDLLPDRPRLR